MLRGNILFTKNLPRQCGGEGFFSFIGVCHEFPAGKVDWRSSQHSKLWRYNLHYFDWLQEEERSNVDQLIDSWIENNPQGVEDAWEPFPVSLRIVNWIKYFLQEGRADELPSAWLESLALQAEWLSRNVEYHLLANHYFKNGKALLFAGIFFKGEAAERWLKLGLKIVLAELPEQVLTDGGHFERSPMYHAMVLEDCLDLLNLSSGVALPELKVLRETLEQRIPGMIRFSRLLAHPDGRMALFNDAAHGIEAEWDALADYYSRLGGEVVREQERGIISLPESGYYRFQKEPGDVLLIDCGEIGPSYQPGHAHCDLLSFELSLGGERFIVDSGCCQYVDEEIRRYNRGNMGHNSLTVDGENQSEVWGAHRVARRAHPLFARVDEEDGTLCFAGAHDGYRRLTGSPMHERRVIWGEDGLRIEDEVRGSGEHELELRLHLHPDCVVERIDDGKVQVCRSGVRVAVSALAGSLLEEQGWYCPEFGSQQRCTVLCVKVRTALPWQGGFYVKKDD